VARDPSFSVLYGDLKVGKTADAIAAFHERAVYIAAPGALGAAESVWGIRIPPYHDLETFKDIRLFDKFPAGTLAVVVDDATLIADRTVNILSARGLGGFDLWAAMFRHAIMLRDQLRRKGMHTVFTGHAAPAEVKQGVRLRGGPAFPGQTRTKLPAAADLLLRAESRPDGAGFGWPIVYRTAPHPDWLQGSRYNTPDMAPMNLGEILRAAGFVIPRAKGLEWQEQVANAVANKLLEPGTLADHEKTITVLRYAHDYAMAKFTKERKHADWALRDGHDRAILRLASGAQHTGLWGF
jgi:hypothetical protein